MKPVIVFDLNETLLDMAALDPAFARIFPVADGSAMRNTWFSQVVELFLTNITSPLARAVILQRSSWA